MDLSKTYDIWKQQTLPKHLQTQLDKMSKTEIEEAFTATLEFGTAGMRGVTGVGTGRINEIIIMKATVAFTQYLTSTFSQKDLNRGIVIAHDNRHFSAEFTMITAKTLAKHNIPVFLFQDNDLRPTPVLSYSIRKINAIAGIVITASHNPPEYNGYKIYDQYGCQFLPEVTNVIGHNMEQLTDDFQLEFPYNKDLIKEVPLTVETNYRNDIKNLQFYPDVKNRNLKIVFSNLHGTSREWVPPLLEQCGYEVIIVKEQASYDPDFKGVISPNPEVQPTFDLAIKYAKQHNAQLVILNDPDADRIGIAVQHQGEYVLLTGNETAPILLEYLLSHYQKTKTMPENPVMYNTFVTSNLSDTVAQSYGCQVIKTLTGFKWIGAEMLKEQVRNINFVFGFEEAYGYVIKDITRDKDGIQSAMVVAEAVWYYLQSQKTLIDVLEDIYKKFGYYYCYTVNLVLKGQKGQTEINGMLETLRTSGIPSLHNIKVEKVEDYEQGLYGTPGQNLLKFYFIDGSWFAVRPSGTEPKIKFYFVCIDKNTNVAKQKMQAMYEELAKKYLKITNIKW
ncbi:phospho-sugar mutase [Spiroplasma endosymbiont of Virgichneumon dumeticola]|uniref:phospho-sugar mutase n=1 Tax=Spiroplasma endosymbiont of Virgichneumon dumeticola TaxID=3139323 RepID=UPI0035C9170F